MEELKTLRKLNSILQGHPDKLKTPGVDMTTGSLGQGLSLGVGMALEGKLVKIRLLCFCCVRGWGTKRRNGLGGSSLCS